MSALARNRKATHEYEVVDQVECGIALQGTEVKSIRNAQVSFSDAFARCTNDEVWMHNVHIAEYSHRGTASHEPLRPRKLLLHRKEITRLQRQVQQKGITLVPLDFHLSHGYVKVALGLCRGKKLYDKRQTLKDRVLHREMEKMQKSRKKSHE